MAPKTLVVLGLLAFSGSRLTTCRSPGSGGGEASNAQPEKTIDLKGIDTSALTAREKSDWSSYVSEALSPCPDQPVSVAQCVNESRPCKACKPAAQYLVEQVRRDPDRYLPEQRRDLAWAIVETEMLRRHVSRRLSDRMDGTTHGPEGSVDKLLMTDVEQAVGHAALTVGGAGHHGGDEPWLETYLYSRAQSVMGGTSQIQRNLVATRILGLPTP